MYHPTGRSLPWRSRTAPPSSPHAAGRASDRGGASPPTPGAGSARQTFTRQALAAVEASRRPTSSRFSARSRARRSWACRQIPPRPSTASTASSRTIVRHVSYETLSRRSGARAISPPPRTSKVPSRARRRSRRWSPPLPGRVLGAPRRGRRGRGQGPRAGGARARRRPRRLARRPERGEAVPGARRQATGRSPSRGRGSSNARAGSASTCPTGPEASGCSARRSRSTTRRVMRAPQHACRPPRPGRALAGEERGPRARRERLRGARGVRAGRRARRGSPPLSPAHTRFAATGRRRSRGRSSPWSSPRPWTRPRTSSGRSPRRHS